MFVWFLFEVVVENCYLIFDGVVFLNEFYMNVGKYYGVVIYSFMVCYLYDIGGGLIMMVFSVVDLENEDVGYLICKYMGIK